ncbi:RluA family pseudouridine synthase [Lentilactobacillus sp. SPB1-3]|uniref:RluA family pseudouridine synthase n=1 Tax=Lentilactobacillus terminaliae TaxID=3003483 RepID=A0ACD5DD99_9LACO|nr:RluA family pseudouridine synthase [Lentilactobacillus sp. SPB1-3]MCZ0977816.1 RluA family pseudouridine synthase [Lentilactobacillus sp. SPB1-3]
MIKFNYRYSGTAPMKLRTFVMGHGVTRTLLKKIKFHGGDTLVNGKSVFTNTMIYDGDDVTVVLPPEEGNDHVIPSYEPIDVVYEDDNYLIVNKTAGVASVPSHIYAKDSLVNRVKGYFTANGKADQRIHIVTRLDRDTSGLVIFAKHHFAHSVLDKALKTHTIYKEYQAIVDAPLISDQIEIHLPIGRAEDSFVKRTIRSDGKQAYTSVYPLKMMDDSTLIRVVLHTGRTHQIRVHLSALGHPLIGDWLYNENDHRMSRQALHCQKISFFDPFSQQQITAYANLAEDMANYLASREF